MTETETVAEHLEQLEQYVRFWNADTEREQRSAGHRL